MIYSRLLLVTSLALALASCSYIYGENGVIKNRDTDYLRATSIPPLKIPPGLSSSSIQSYYPISEREYPSPGQKVNLTPPELNNTRN
jgi:uncharacterized lipoprotein